MATEAKFKENSFPARFNKLFSWDNIRILLGKSFSNIILFTGCATSSTGAFKGLPYLLPGINPILLYVLISLAVFSAFTFFWSSYHDHLTQGCFWVLDYGKYLFNKLRGLDESKNPKPGNIKNLEENLIDSLEKNKENYNIFNSIMARLELRARSCSNPEYLAQLTNEERNYKVKILTILNRIQADEKRLVTDRELITQIQDESQNSKLFNKYKIVAKIFAVVTSLVGALVGIGMSTLTNQGFFIFLASVAGIASFNPAVAVTLFGISVVAAFFTQASKQAFNGKKQFDTIASWLKAKTSPNEIKRQRLKNASINNNSYDKWIAELKVVEKKLDNIEENGVGKLADNNNLLKHKTNILSYPMINCMQLSASKYKELSELLVLQENLYDTWTAEKNKYIKGVTRFSNSP